MLNNWTLLILLLGLALLIVGTDLVYAYRRIIPYNTPYNKESTEQNLPTWLANTLMNFVKAGYACLIGGPLLLLVALTYNVMHHRVRVLLEANGKLDEKAERIVRVHANFAEYVPTGLALMIVLEWPAHPSLWFVWAVDYPLWADPPASQGAEINLT